MRPAFCRHACDLHDAPAKCPLNVVAGEFPDYDTLCGLFACMDASWAHRAHILLSAVGCYFIVGIECYFIFSCDRMLFYCCAKMLFSLCVKN